MVINLCGVTREIGCDKLVVVLYLILLYFCLRVTVSSPTDRCASTYKSSFNLTVLSMNEWYDMMSISCFTGSFTGEAGGRMLVLNIMKV